MRLSRNPFVSSLHLQKIAQSTQPPHPLLIETQHRKSFIQSLNTHNAPVFPSPHTPLEFLLISKLLLPGIVWTNY